MKSAYVARGTGLLSPNSLEIVEQERARQFSRGGHVTRLTHLIRVSRAHSLRIGGDLPRVVRFWRIVQVLRIG